MLNILLLNVRNKIKIETLTGAIIGQSNAGRRENVASMTGQYTSLKKNYTNVKTALRNGQTYPFVDSDLILNQYNASSGYYGAELGISNVLSSKVTNLNLIQFFVGSNDLKTNFNPNLSESTHNQYYYGIWNSAGTGFLQQVLTNYGLSLDFVVWIQGEQDAVINSTTYETDLSNFKGILRTHFNSNLLFVYNQLITPFNLGNSESGKNAIRLAQVNNQTTKDLIINMDDIGTGDQYEVHYAPNPLAELGVRFGNKIKTYYNI